LTKGLILLDEYYYPKHDIKSNLINHYNLIDLVSKNGANLIVFPEMYATVYERNKASDFNPEIE
jgi:predicted amidohydrolase